MPSRTARTAQPPAAVRRSILSVPASDGRKVSKALSGSADELVLDLEDAVVAGAKDDARRSVCAALSHREPGARPAVTVRVNAPGSPWCHLDLLALAQLEHLPASVVVPKVESPGDLVFVARLLDGALAGRPDAHTLAVQALIETAAGLARVVEIAEAGERLDGLVLGYADLAASLGRPARGREDPTLWLPAQQAVVTAARTAGIAAVDGPHLGVEVDDPFTSAARRAADLGFDGKWAIHPRQVSALNEAFTPTPEEVAQARRVLSAMERAASSQAGAVALDGQMLDEAVALAARRVVARAEAAR